MSSLLRNLRAMLLIPLLATVSIFIGCDKKVTDPPPDPPAGSVLLVANFAGGAGYMTMVDIETGAIRLGVAGLGNIPNDILRHENKIFVVNSNSQDMNVLAISDANVLTSVDTVDLEFSGNRWPQYVTRAATGDLYISNFKDNSVSLVSPTTMTLDLLIPVGQSPQDVLAYQDKVYVCISGYHDNAPYDSIGIVAVVSTTSNRVVSRIEVGVNPQYMAMDGNNVVHVVCSGTFNDIPGKIYKIDSATDAVTQVINIGGLPGEVAISGQFGYVAYYGDGTVGHLYRYNINTGLILNGSVANGANSPPIVVSKGAGRVIAGSDGAIYVSCWDTNKTDKVVGTERTASWPVGDNPGAMLLVER